MISSLLIIVDSPPGGFSPSASRHPSFFATRRSSSIIQPKGHQPRQHPQDTDAGLLLALPKPHRPHQAIRSSRPAPKTSPKTLTTGDPCPAFHSITNFAPATLAILGPGFDFLNCVIDGVGNTVTIAINPVVPVGTLSNSSLLVLLSLLSAWWHRIVAAALDPVLIRDAQLKFLARHAIIDASKTTSAAPDITAINNRSSCLGDPTSSLKKHPVPGLFSPTRLPSPSPPTRPPITTCPETTSCCRFPSSLPLSFHETKEGKPPLVNVKKKKRKKKQWKKKRGRKEK